MIPTARALAEAIGSDGLATILRLAPAGILAQAPDGSLLYANEEAARFFRFDTVEALLRAGPAAAGARFEVFDADDRPLPPDRYPARVALRGHEAAPLVIRFRDRATGEEGWNLVRAAPVFGEGGAIRCAVTVWHDVTEAKRAERAARFLADAGEQLESSRDLHATLRGIVVAAVPVLGDLCALDLLEADGSVRRVAAHHVDPELDALLRRLEERGPCVRGTASVIEAGEPELVPEIAPSRLDEIEGDAAYRAALRQLAPRSYLAVPLKVQGRTLGALALVVTSGARRYGEADVALAQDLARRAALALENAKLLEATQAAVRSRDDFLAMASHDLKNPLGVVTMNASILERVVTADPACRTLRLVDGIRRAGEQMQRLIEDLLDVASVEAGQLRLEPVEVQASELLAEVAALHGPTAATRSVELVSDASDAGPVRCDRQRVLQVLGNLVANALRYAPPGTRVRLAAARAGDVVQVSVADQGPGIRPDELPRIFERYYRGGDKGGTGLGLFIARALVEAHGGRLDAEAPPGGGSRFRFTLPAG